MADENQKYGYIGRAELDEQTNKDLEKINKSADDVAALKGKVEANTNKISEHTTSISNISNKMGTLSALNTKYTTFDSLSKFGYLEDGVLLNKIEPLFLRIEK